MTVTEDWGDQLRVVRGDMGGSLGEHKGGGGQHTAVHKEGAEIPNLGN